MKPIFSAALDAVRADPEDFVDRTELQEELCAMLESRITSGSFQARITITGEKGVGKTILTRAVLRSLHKKHRFVLVEVDGRGKLYRPFLHSLSSSLVEEGLRWAEQEETSTKLVHYLRDLGVLTMTDSITVEDAHSIATEYGAGAGIQGGLFGALMGSGLLNWKQTRELGSSTQQSRQVTDELLHSAISKTLEQMMLAGISVVLFLNDLDQAQSREDPDAISSLIGNMVSLEPCIQVINIRPEVLYDDLRRESDPIDVPPMTADALLEMYDARVKRENRDDVRTQLESMALKPVLKELAELNGNPFAFLRWVNAYLRTFGTQPHELTADVCENLIKKTNILASELPLIQKLLAIVERISGTWFTKEELLRGGYSTDPDRGSGLSEREVADLVRIGSLIPRDIYSPDKGMRAEPMLDLLKARSKRA